MMSHKEFIYIILSGSICESMYWCTDPREGISPCKGISLDEIIISVEPNLLRDRPETFLSVRHVS